QRQRRVLRLAVGQLADVVGGDALEVRERPGALHLQLAHVRDVEEPGGGAHGHVLGDEARILHRHLPPAEGHHLGPQLAVNGIQWRLAQRTDGGLQPPSIMSKSEQTRGVSKPTTRRAEVNEPERLDRKGLGVYRVRIRRWLPLAFETYLTTCWNCLGEFDALHAVWCSDDPKSPTKLCPFCFR